MKRSYSTVAPLMMVLGLLATVSFVLGIGEVSPTYAQTCDPNTTPKIRPTDPRKPFLRQNDTVYVIIESSITSQDQINQMARGLTSWGNVAGLQFIIGAPPANGPFSTGPEPTVIYFQNANLGRVPYAQTVYTATHADGSLASATVTFNIGAMTAQTAGGPNDGPFYNPNLPGYDTIFQKETEHEIGHPIGLQDATGQNHESVMNSSAFDCPNDICGMKPLEVSPCDKGAAQQVPRPLDSGSSDPGSGGGAGGGGGDCPCSDCVNGCSSGGGGGDGTNCDWVEAGGQCYAGVDYYDDYGYLIDHQDGYCDPPQSTYVCW